MDLGAHPIAGSPVAGLPSVPASADVYIGAQNPDPIFIQSFQYESHVDPIIPIASPETLTLDKWKPVCPEPYFRRRRLIQYGVNTAIAEQADDGLPPVHWIPPANQPLNPRPRFRANGSSVLDTFPLPNAPTPQVYIQGQGCDPIFVRSFQYDSGVGSPQPVAPAETITIDKWSGYQPAFIYRRRRLNQYEPGASSPRPIVAETITIDKWIGFQPPFIYRKRVQRIAPTAFVQVVAATDFLAPARNVATISLVTQNSGSITITSQNAGTVDAINNQTATITITSQNTGTI